MQQALDAPTVVQDDLPTLSSELRDWWDKRLKPFIDFKSFLRQRRAILRDRELTRSTQPPFEGWKNPFAFALSASTLTFTIVALIGVAFHALFPDPDLKHDWIARGLQTRLTTANARLARMHATDAAYVGLAAQRDQLASDLNDHTTGLTVPHEGVLLSVGAPLVVYFLGVFFPKFVQRRVPSAPYASSAREIVYYYFTARTFWPGFLLVTGGAVYFFLMKYSLFSTYNELPQTFPVGSGPLYALLVLLATIGAIPFIYAFFATPVAFHKCAREISAVLGVHDDRRAQRAIYWGLLRAVFYSSILAFSLTILLVGVYAGIDTGSQSIRSTMGTSLSTASSVPNP